MKKGRSTVGCGPDTTPNQLYISTRHFGLEKGPLLCQGAAKYDNFRCLIMAVSLGCTVDAVTGEKALISGNMKIIQWLSDFGFSFHPQKSCVVACKSGKVEVLEWCMKRFEFSSECILTAARYGHIPVLKHLVANGCGLKESPIHPYRNAIRGGHINVLWYLYETDVPNFVWDPVNVIERSMMSRHGSVDDQASLLTNGLAMCDKVKLSMDDLLRLISLGPKYFYLVESNLSRVEGYPDDFPLHELDSPGSVVDEAVSTGTIDNVDWLVSKGFPLEENTALSHALALGKMDLLETFVSRGLKWTPNSCRKGFREAAYENRRDDIETCTDHPGGETIFGDGRGNDICERAADGEALSTLEYALMKTEGPKDEGILVCAVQTGNLAIVKTVLEGGVLPEDNSIISAVEVDDIEIVRCLLDTGCPTEDIMYDLVERCDDDNMRDFLVKSGVLPPTPNLVEGIVLTESCDLLEWALGVCDQVSENALYAAASLESHAPLMLLYTKVDEDSWKKAYPGMWSRAGCDEMKVRIEKTKTW